MPSFNAASVVEPLDYDLTAYVPGRKGVLKEPSDDQLTAFERAFYKETQRLRKLLGPLPDGDDPDEYLVALEKRENAAVSAEVNRTWKIQAAFYAGLCSGEPSEADIMALPRRVRVHFFRWLREELVNPEAEAGAGTAEVISLPSAAAG
jgi:hypothetical protein